MGSAPNGRPIAWQDELPVWFSPERARGFARVGALRWTLIAFFVGESVFLLHTYGILVLHRELYLTEYLHDYGVA